MQFRQIGRSARTLLVGGLMAGTVLATSSAASAQALPGPQPPLQINWKPDLTITMTDAPDPVVFYSTPLTYTITLRNVPDVILGGPSAGRTAQWVQMRQILPQGFSVQSVSAPSSFQCTYNTMNVICQGGPMASGSTVTIRVTGYVPPNTIGFITSTATVDTWNLIEERNESNNSASTTTLLSDQLII